MTIALPFARITSTDDGLRDAVADLARLVAQLAAAVSAVDAAAIETARVAAEELAGRVAKRR